MSCPLSFESFASKTDILFVNASRQQPLQTKRPSHHHYDTLILLWMLTECLSHTPTLNITKIQWIIKQINRLLIIQTQAVNYARAVKQGKMLVQ